MGINVKYKNNRAGYALVTCPYLIPSFSGFFVKLTITLITR